MARTVLMLGFLLSGCIELPTRDADQMMLGCARRAPVEECSISAKSPVIRLKWRLGS